MSNAYDQGYELFKLDPSLTLLEIWRHAARLYVDREQQDEFVSSYVASRMRKDEFERKRHDEE
jgi:hypothetical protein